MHHQFTDCHLPSTVIVLSGRNKMTSLSSPPITNYALTDLFRPRFTFSLKAFQGFFFRFVLNSSLFLSPYSCSFFLQYDLHLLSFSRQLVLLSNLPNFLPSFYRGTVCTSRSSENFHLDRCLYFLSFLIRGQNFASTSNNEGSQCIIYIFS